MKKFVESKVSEKMCLLLVYALGLTIVLLQCRSIFTGI